MGTAPSSYGKIGLASLIMMVSVFSSRIIGLVREVTIAWSGGAGGGVDAYQVAFILPEILNHVVASGFLSITFIPMLSRYISRNDPEGGWQLLSTIITVIGTVLVLLTLTTSLFAPELVHLLAPGLTDPILSAQAVRMTRIILPAQLFFFCGGLFMAVMFTRKQFLLPALAPIVYNLGIILGGVILSPRFGMEGFAWGVLGGAFAGNFLIQYWGARRCGMRLYPAWQVRHPDFIQYLLLTLPLMVGLTMTFSTEILLKFFGSFLSGGSIAALNYALRIMFILVGLFGQAVGVASYPYMATMAAEGRIVELNELLNRTLRFLALVIPVSVLFMVLRREIVFLLFQRGAFDAAATALTAQVLPWLMTGTVAFAAQTVVVRGFYAAQNTWTPALFGTLAVLAGLPLFPVLLGWLGAPGVALALSLTALGQTLLLFVIWNRKSGNSGGKAVYAFVLKITLVSLSIAAVLLPIHHMCCILLQQDTRVGAVIICLIMVTFFTAAASASGRIFHISEIRILETQVVNGVRNVLP